VGLGVLLEQLIPLLLDLGGLLVVLLRPHWQGLECLLSLISIPMSLGHPRPKTVCLLGEGSQLGNPLLGNNKLSHYLPA